MRVWRRLVVAVGGADRFVLQIAGVPCDGQGRRRHRGHHGGVAQQLGRARLVGAPDVVVWFAALAVAARLAHTVLTRPRVWRIVDCFVAVVMTTTELRLLLAS